LVGNKLWAWFFGFSSRRVFAGECLSVRGVGWFRRSGMVRRVVKGGGGWGWGWWARGVGWVGWGFGFRGIGFAISNEVTSI
jgi:hypothetical protein